MQMLKTGRMGIGLVAVLLLLSACTSSTADSTTSVPSIPVTTLVSPGDTSAPVSTTSTTEEPKTILTAPEYIIAQRISGDDVGDTVVALLDPTTYNSLTDIDLYDLLAEIVERFPPISSIHIVDTAAAAVVVTDPDASNAERAAISDNYFALLEDGFRITYLGPFASSGTAVLGS